MFTGIIQGQGRVTAMRSQGGDARLSLAAEFDIGSPDPLRQGESIAVNGVCLTVEGHSQRAFTAYASGETLARSNLSGLAVGSVVNLERALAMGERLGGHIVSGHVDCVALVERVREAGASRVIRLTFPEGYAPEVIPKGSVTLDGISLTVNACSGVGEPGWLEVNVIPETWRVTTVAHWTGGARVNMETDVLGKYVRRMLLPWRDAGGGASAPGGVTEEFLRLHGFL